MARYPTSDPPLSFASVVIVACIGILENFLQNFLWELFGFAYTDYTTYIGRGLELHHWLDTVPLHPAGGPRLVDVSEFV